MSNYYTHGSPGYSVGPMTDREKVKQTRDKSEAAKRKMELLRRLQGARKKCGECITGC